VEGFRYQLLCILATLFDENRRVISTNYLQHLDLNITPISAQDSSIGQSNKYTTGFEKTTLKPQSRYVEGILQYGLRKMQSYDLQIHVQVEVKQSWTLSSESNYNLTRGAIE
jgi:hypothetical protein